jgi:hypothetical protein
MSEDIIPYNENQQRIEQFQKLLNMHPDKKDIRVNKMANNAEYISISTIERRLDEIYSGLWQIDNFRWEVVANEIIGSIDLKVYHPKAGWITRTGAAAAMILTSSGKPATVEFKIKNTLVKDFPHLKAECLKNAAKSLGVIFGRNLNRGQEDEFTYLSESLPQLGELQLSAFELLETSTLTPDFREKFAKKINRATNETLKDIITYLKRNQ